MATYDYNLDEDRFSGYLSQVQIPGVTKPYLIKDYEAREAANQAQEYVDNLTEVVNGVNSRIDHIEISSGNVYFNVEEDTLIISRSSSNNNPDSSDDYEYIPPIDEEIVE